MDSSLVWFVLLAGLSFTCSELLTGTHSGINEFVDMLNLYFQA